LKLAGERSSIKDHRFILFRTTEVTKEKLGTKDLQKFSSGLRRWGKLGKHRPRKQNAFS
jgi:hypothetical protein